MFDLLDLFEIEQKGLTFVHDFCYSFTFSSTLFFLGGKRNGEKNNQSRGQKACLSARSFLDSIRRKKYWYSENAKLILNHYQIGYFPKVVISQR